MLPNHAPLMVAERFKVLEALFPGRIDLGIGRAPGTDPVTSYALRRRQTTPTTTISSNAFRNCCCSSAAAFPADHPFSKVYAMPKDVALPPIWLLGSSGLQRAARRHGRRRIFVRASFLRSRCGRRRCWAIASSSSRRAALDKPYAILGCAVVCADTRRARPSGLPPRSISTGCAARAANCCRSRVPRRRWRYPYSPVDRERIRHRRARLFVGTPATVLRAALRR